MRTGMHWPDVSQKFFFWTVFSRQLMPFSRMPSFSVFSIRLLDAGEDCEGEDEVEEVEDCGDGDEGAFDEGFTEI